MIKWVLAIVFIVALFTGCLRTRSEVGELNQTNTYGQKIADNQMAEQQGQSSQRPDPSVSISVPDEKDELIRGLNGRVEVLENQLQTMNKEREDEKKQYEQKLVLLQEAITKLENDMNPPADTEDNKAVKNDEMQSSDDLAKAKNPKTTVNATDKKLDTKPANPLTAGEEFYANQDWKKAILSFHQYTDETPKGKHVPEAKYKIGVCFQQLGMREEAMAYFEEVAANFGSTDAGKKSKSRLAKLKK
jgi:TolA-binding protein